MTPKRTPNSPSILTFQEALAAAAPRPADDESREPKKNYAERLSNSIAVLIANKLRATGQFEGILPDPEGRGRESRSASGSGKKAKKTDVRFATNATGLELLVSIKTLSFKDAKRDRETGTISLGRYTKNMVRNDHELRAEAMDHHERFPFAVLIGLLFLPLEACDDGPSDKSSFAHAVMTFRPRTGRAEPSDHPAKFERFFIGLYSSTPASSDVGFFDVATAPPKRGRPPMPPEPPDPSRGGRLLSLEELVTEIVRMYGIRNRTYIHWADESPTSTSPPVVAVTDDQVDEPDEDDDSA